MENNIEDSVSLVKIVRLINTLPDDVMRHIYEEYFVCKDACNKYLRLLESNTPQELIYGLLVEPTRRLLAYSCAIEYLCTKHLIFKQMYIKHYIKNNKWYEKMSTFESFITSILVNLYH
jgi:hypothetical protein